ncbi:hypothetical protein N7509_001142 [Penicillium cosmopolitanum]|uniref:Potassium uptake protein n=1 Tax=Penicillium cosmopolitanum TaxID=1131564 RepID=A0A9X0BEU3_9EURO|nr:uncharacterized protein N7509_001142 [Penicillium cosmopolitanum]KAJ5414515.1 hypothetical protein N7509_001142 [Penicillium cosmopolitanum]
MTTIRIADSVSQGDGLGRTTAQDDGNAATGVTMSRTRSVARSDVAENDDNIYNIRSRPTLPERIGGRSTVPEEADENPRLQQAGDFKEKQIFKGRVLLWLSYQSIGVIYGDIGTSPLYVYSSTFSSAPSRQDLVGMNITHRDPREASLVRMKRYLSGDLERAGQRVRHRIETSKFAKGLLKVIGVLAVTMVLSDGLLTPAQSVLGAVQGIKVVQPNISKGTVIGVTDAILVLLFSIQPLGITKISYAFSPIIIIWLGFNAVFGIYNIVRYDASVFQAFNPALAFDFLARRGEKGWRMLGGVLLAFTGVEALFADLGAFSRRAIQISWLCYTFPCILLAYIGQAAYISVHPDAYSNPFFNAAPPGTIYPSLVIAILAAIVASQAIITATFQLLAQVMKLSYFPQIKVVHTSRTFHGQLYVPIANWLLMIGTILVASIYNNTTSLGNAYGVCVMFVTFFDTCMVSLAAMFVWRISPYLVFLPWLIIACLDGTYLSSALTKVPSGAWFTIVLSSLLAMLFLLWRYGKEQQWFAESEDRFPTSHFVTTESDGQMRLSNQYGNTPINSSRGLGIFFDKAGETTPIVFSQFVLKLTSIPEVTVFFHLRPLEMPSVAPESRHSVSRLSIPNCYRLVVRYGYNDVIIAPNLSSIIVDQIRRYLSTAEVSQLEQQPTPSLPIEAATNESSNGRPSENRSDNIPATDDGENGSKQLNHQLARLEEACAHKVLYIIGKEEMKIKTEASYVRKTLLYLFLWIRDNTRNKMANLQVPTDKVIEVGFLKEI